MKRVFYFVLALIFSYTTLQAEVNSTSKTSKLDKMSEVVAKVNQEPIVRVELERAIDALAPRTFFHAGITDEKRRTLESKALEKLIDKRLTLQYAKKLGIKATEGEINNQELKIREPFKDDKSFIVALKKARFDYKSFRKDLGDDVIISKFYTKEIKADFTDAELKEYYEKNIFKFKEPERVQVRLIYIKNDPRDPKGRDKAEAKAKEVYKKIKEGADFADMAAKYSNDMSRIKGGDMGYIHKGMLDPDVDEVVYKLKSGELSEIIENTKGFYIALVERKDPKRLLPFKDVKDKLKKELIASTEKKREENLLKKLKDAAKIERYLESSK